MSHLCAVNQTYFVHLKEAWTMSGCSIYAGCIMFVHGLFPDIFQTHAGDLLIFAVDKLKLQRLRKAVTINTCCNT